MDIDDAALEHFSRHILSADKTEGATRARWKRAALLRDSHGLCQLCGADYSGKDTRGLYASAVLLPHLGGSKYNYINRLVLCSSCSRRRARQDIIEPTFLKKIGGTIPDKVLQARSEILLNGENHLTPHPPREHKDRVTAHLKARHINSRFRVFALDDPDQPMIGWKKKELNPQDHGGAGVLLKHCFSCTRVPHPTLVLFTLPNETYLDAIWELIEFNALVRPVQPATPLHDNAWELAHLGDWRITWRTIYDRLSDNVRRRAWRETTVKPWAPRVLSQKRSAVWMRERNTKKQAGNSRVAERDYLHGLDIYERYERLTSEEFEWFASGNRGLLNRMRDEAIWLMSTKEERRALLKRQPDWPIPPMD